jgi:Rieske Fe-S protein
MTGESQQVQRASRRGVLLGVGLVGVGGALAGCSTKAIPYDSNEAGVAPGQETPTPAASSQMTGQAAGMAQGATTGAGGTTTGTLLGYVKDVPVGGGTVFMDQKVVVTQPTKGVFRAFSAVCTHVGCICNKVANGTIDCPCHGAQFKITNGAVVAGPAPTPLPTRTITVSGDKIMLA